MKKYFGTDGVRGEANRDLTAELAQACGLITCVANLPVQFEGTADVQSGDEPKLLLLVDAPQPTQETLVETAVSADTGIDSDAAALVDREDVIDELLIGGGLLRTDGKYCLK